MNNWLINSFLGAAAFVILLLTIRVYQIPVPNDNQPLLPTQALPTNKPTPTRLPENQLAVKIYFHDDVSDPSVDDCTKNTPKIENIPQTTTPLKDTIELLLQKIRQEDNQGDQKRADGFKLKSASITNGIASLVFVDPLFYTSGGSCRVGSLYSRIEDTAKQFPGVKSVKISGAPFQL